MSAEIATVAKFSIADFTRDSFHAGNLAKKQCLHIGVDARFAIAEHSLINPILRTLKIRSGQ
jgi:hypothetical protein